MWGPSGYQIITPNIDPVLGLKTVNITSAFYKMLSLKPEHILVREKLDQYYSIKKLLEKIQSAENIIEIQLNESNVGKTTFDLKPFLRGQNYGVVAYNFKSPKVQCYNNPVQFNGLILISFSKFSLNDCRDVHRGSFLTYFVLLSYTYLSYL